MTKPLFFLRAIVAMAILVPGTFSVAQPLLFTKQYNYQGLHIYDTFYQWRPGGGIYVLENPDDPSEERRIRPVIDPETPETLGPGIYFDASLSYDAKKILFCFKGEPHGNSTIYEIGVDGTGLRQVTNLDKNGNPYKGSGGGHHDVNPCYLPDGRIVFCSTRYSGLVPCANNGVAVLHVMNADGSDIHTISVNNVTEFNPCVLPDGRILFGRWEYIDKNALTIQSLWTVMPDGTGETALFANNMVFPEAVLQAKPVPGHEHLIVGTFAPHNAPPRGSIAMIDTRLGKNEEKAIFNFEHHDRPTFDRGESRDPWALDENTVLYSGIPDSDNVPKIGNDTPAGKRSNPKLNAIMTIDRTGKKTVVLSDPVFDLKRPIPLVSRPKPRVVADTTDRTKIEGDFFVHDVYEGMPQVPRGSIQWLRVTEETSRVSESPGKTWMNQTFSISAALAWSPKIYHGIVPVREDGSVYFTAPSGRSLNFQLLDKDYRLVRSMRTFIQAAPGTTRSCTGCHEYKYGATSSAAQSRLLGRDPEPLRDESWGSGYVDYPSMVQPILDKHCVRCHGGEEGFAAGLDFTGGWTEYFNISYENLTARREKQYVADLIQGICCMNGTAHWSCKIFEPYEHGSGNALLADRLISNKTLSQAERELLMTWIDSNGLYFGTWDYTKTGARCKEYPVVRDAIKSMMKRNSCVECHADEKGNIKRFDDWINLERPELSRVLRAPLTSEAVNGLGVGLCRNRKVDPNFSRLGLMFKSGYEHSVRDLEKFPTQVWQPWEKSLEGEAVVSFASTEDPVYQEMLGVIKEASQRQKRDPRIDMPRADEIGDGIKPGRSRQIIPQPLPETVPKLEVETDSEGTVRLRWERSRHTIGLMAEIHRSTDGPTFTPSEKTLLKTTELFRYTDRDAPVGQTVHYAVVLVSDPAATCGTVKSGAVLRFGDGEDFVAPMVGSIESRCPLSDFKPMRAKPVYCRIDVPVPGKPAAPTELKAVAWPGRVDLSWADSEPGVYRYNIYRAENEAAPVMLNKEPANEGFYRIVTDDEKEYEYFVRVVGRGGESDNSTLIRLKALPLRKDPVFELEKTEGRLDAPARLDGGVLDLSEGGCMTIPVDDDFNIKTFFRFEMDVTFTEPGEKSVVLSHGIWNQSGWFLQKLGDRWRFHAGGVNCDGGTVPIGEKIHLRGTFDGTKLSLYQDGQLVAEQAAGLGSPWTKEFLIGRYNGNADPGYQFKGRIENLRIFHCLPEEASE